MKIWKVDDLYMSSKVNDSDSKMILEYALNDYEKKGAKIKEILYVNNVYKIVYTIEEGEEL